MIDIPAALVDTHVIFDIIGEDPTWGSWSAKTLEACESPFVNPAVFAELCYVKPSADEVEKLLEHLEIGYREISKDALFLAAQAYKMYRQRGGIKTAPLPDFFIGAHAVSLGIPLITRDVGRYRAYFPTVPLICP